MASIGFIGVGNMGGPMARNLVAAGHRVRAFDLIDAALDKAVADGCAGAGSAAEAAGDAEVVITMLPAGEHARAVYLGAGGVVAAAAENRVDGGTLLIDCSTIDVATARELNAAAGAAGLEMVDAPVSGGVTGAAAATLTIMLGGGDAAVARARPILERLGRNVVHAGPAGNGQAAKTCNNMILGITMIGISEAFGLAEKLGLEPRKLFEIASVSSGSCWAMLNHCPVPGIVETSAANRGFAPGFAAAMMHKDLKLAQDAANKSGAATPLGAAAAALYTLYVNAGHGGMDYSGIINMIRGDG
ncbi:MAG: 3-hydroxyisobutyrate dehydrogenase [Kiloniellales bacterium]